MSDPLKDPNMLDSPLAIYEAMQAAGTKSEEDFAKLTRQLFNTVKGRAWLVQAMHRTNFMGSVFSADEGMHPTTAAHRDGRRSLLSEILNAAFDGKTKPTRDHDDDE